MPPVPLHYSPFDDAIFEDPYPIYTRLRAESPVHYVSEFDCWALSTFEDVWDACQSPDLYTAEQGTTAGHLLQKVLEVFPALDMMDPPRHTAHRALVSQRFGPGFVRQFEDDVRKIVRDRSTQCETSGDLTSLKISAATSLPAPYVGSSTSPHPIPRCCEVGWMPSSIASLEN